jgi:hypothetical protein
MLVVGGLDLDPLLCFGTATALLKAGRWNALNVGVDYVAV